MAKDRKGEYDFYKSIGICVRCHKNKAEHNKVMCWECAEKDNERRRKIYHADIEEAHKKDKEKIERLKQKGICIGCKNRRAKEGRVRCEICLKKAKQRRDNNRRDIARTERVSYGLCYICGNKIADGYRVCSKCLATRQKSIDAIAHASIKDKNVKIISYGKVRREA